MPNRSSKPPSDPNLAAKNILGAVTSSDNAEQEPVDELEARRQAAAMLGRRGGLKGGKARAAALSPEVLQFATVSYSLAGGAQQMQTYQVVGGWHAEERSRMVACFAETESAAKEALKTALERAARIEALEDEKPAEASQPTD